MAPSLRNCKGLGLLSVALASLCHHIGTPYTKILCVCLGQGGTFPFSRMLECLTPPVGWSEKEAREQMRADPGLRVPGEVCCLCVRTEAKQISPPLHLMVLAVSFDPGTALFVSVVKRCSSSLFAFLIQKALRLVSAMETLFATYFAEKRKVNSVTN